MSLGQEFRILGDWFIIHFTENNGMAFGFEFAGEKGKLFLTIFRIVAATLIAAYIYHLNKRKAHTLLIFSISLIFAGAVGNIIDSIFYGRLFSESTFFKIAEFLPAERGYAPLMHGMVVDMFYFPIIKSQYPAWFPWWGGQEFIFFRPVFNVADASITTGVMILLVFQKKFFHHKTPADYIDNTSTNEVIINQSSDGNEEKQEAAE